MLKAPKNLIFLFYTSVPSQRLQLNKKLNFLNKRNTFISLFEKRVLKNDTIWLVRNFIEKEILLCFIRLFVFQALKSKTPCFISNFCSLNLRSISGQNHYHVICLMMTLFLPILCLPILLLLLIKIYCKEYLSLLQCHRIHICMALKFLCKILSPSVMIFAGKDFRR